VGSGNADNDSADNHAAADPPHPVLVADEVATPRHEPDDASDTWLNSFQGLTAAQAVIVFQLATLFLLFFLFLVCYATLVNTGVTRHGVTTAVDILLMR